MTSGTFDQGDMADNFDDYSSSDEAAPPFPGEDYLTNAPDGLTFPTDLAGAAAVISIEPRMDNSPAPFQFKPLVGTIPSDATDHTLYSVDDMSSTLPTGSVSISSVASDQDDAGIPLIGITLLAVVLLPILNKKIKSN